MKRLATLAAMLFAIAVPTWAAYSYYLSIPNMSSFNWSQWTLNDTLSVQYFTDTGGYYGLASTSGYSGSVISNVAVPDGSSEYEVKMKVRGSCKDCRILLRASSNASADGSVGTAYHVVLNDGYVAVYKYVSGSVTTLAYGYAYGTIPFEKNLRAVIRADGKILVYIENNLALQPVDTWITSGKPGVAISNTVGDSRIVELYIGPLDRTAPNALSSSNLSTTSFSNRVDMQWSGLSDDANGIGLLSSKISRNGTMVGYANNVFSDPTVSPATTYTYSLTATDFHGNHTTSSFTLTTPASGSIDPRRVGVRATGTYWGAKGEQIDLLSGNLNYTVPLISAKSRGGWSVPIVSRITRRTGERTAVERSGIWVAMSAMVMAGNCWLDL